MPLLRIPARSDIGLLWSAGSVTALGTAATSVVMPLAAVTTLHASTLDVGVLAALGVAPWLLFGLLAGVWVDFFPRRKLLVACDLVRAAALASIPASAALGVLTLVQLFAVAFAVGTASVFFDIGWQSFVPQVVEYGKLMTVNSRLQGGQQAAAIAGPGVGGWLVELVHAPAALLLDVGTYVMSAMCLWGIRGAGRDVMPPAPHGGVATRIREGIAYLWSRSVLRSLAVMAASINFSAAAIMALQVPFLVRTLHLAPGMVGLLVGVEAPGALLGTAVSVRLTVRFGTAGTVAISVVAGPACALLMPLAWHGAGVVLFAAGAAGLALLTVVFSIVARVYRQKFVPAEMLGRVTAVNRVLSWGVMPAGALLGGWLATEVGIRPAFLSVAIAMAVMIPLPFLLSPLRGSRDLEDAEITSDRRGDEDVGDRAGHPDPVITEKQSAVDQA